MSAASALATATAAEIEKKLGLVKHYYREILMICFGVAIVFLFKGQEKLNNSMKTYLFEDRKDMIVLMTKNIATLERIAAILERQTNPKLDDIKENTEKQ